MKMYLVYRIKDNGRFASELVSGGLYSTIDEAFSNAKRGWHVKRVAVKDEHND